MTGTEPIPVRLARAQALAGAALGLIGAVRRERPDEYAGFIGSCLVMGQGGAADAR